MVEHFSFLQDILQHLDYFWVTVLMAVESSFIPFPSEVVVPPAAYRAANGELNIILVVLFATLGSNIGGVVNYYLARYLGRPVVYRFAGSLIGRLIPAVRQLISIPAGLAGMPLGRFLLYTTLGAGAWNIVLAVLGWVIGRTVPPERFAETIQSYSSTIGLVIAGVLIVGGLAYYLLKHRKK